MSRVHSLRTYISVARGLHTFVGLAKGLRRRNIVVSQKRGFSLPRIAFSGGFPRACASERERERNEADKRTAGRCLFTIRVRVEHMIFVLCELRPSRKNLVSSGRFTCACERGSEVHSANDTCDELERSPKQSTEGTNENQRSRKCSAHCFC